MNNSILELKNLGSKSSAWLNETDIFSRQDIVELGPVNIYTVLKTRGYPVTIVIAHALQGAIEDVHWNQLPEDVKSQLNMIAKFRSDTD